MIRNLLLGLAGIVLLVVLVTCVAAADCTEGCVKGKFMGRSPDKPSDVAP